MERGVSRIHFRVRKPVRKPLFSADCPSLSHHWKIVGKFKWYRKYVIDEEHGQLGTRQCPRNKGGQVYVFYYKGLELAVRTRRSDEQDRVSGEAEQGGMW
jgi:hypothetical protein